MRQYFTPLDILIGITVSSGAVSLPENIWTMNTIVLMWMCGVCWHMKQSQGQLFLGEDNITSNSFLEIWENFAPLQLNNSNNLILLLDTVLLHFVHNVCNSQNVNFQCQWTGREGPIVWPPHSPDLIPLFLLWGYVKDQVFKVQICWMNSRHGLMQQI